MASAAARRADHRRTCGATPTTRSSSASSTSKPATEPPSRRALRPVASGHHPLRGPRGRADGIVGGDSPRLPEACPSPPSRPQGRATRARWRPSTRPTGCCAIRAAAPLYDAELARRSQRVVTPQPDRRRAATAARPRATTAAGALSVEARRRWGRRRRGRGARRRGAVRAAASRRRPTTSSSQGRVSPSRPTATPVRSRAPATADDLVVDRARSTRRRLPARRVGPPRPAGHGLRLRATRRGLGTIDASRC